MKIAVKNWKNESIREIEVPDAVFGYPYKEHLIHLAVEANRAAQRRGTHKVKVRSEVRGSGRKLWRQKGTGRARVGSIRTPLWRSGGTVHGPQPRSYDKDMAPREKRAALKSALARKLADEQFIVVENFDLETFKTAELARQVSGLGITGKALLVDRFDNENLTRASRNNPAFKTADALAVNVYDVVAQTHVVVSEEALSRLMEVLDR